MNDLGLTLAWTALRVSLVMIPTVALHALASRRSAASGSWMAALGLGLSVAITLAIFISWALGAIESAVPSLASSATVGIKEANGNATDTDLPGVSIATEAGREDVGMSVSLGALRRLSTRIERGTAAPLNRFRAWGRAFAAACLAGTGIGLLRLFLGLWDVRLCRRRGTIVNDPDLIDLLHEIRTGIGCRQGVEILQVPAILTPATAGWRHPVILLPADWSSWDDTIRRAVFAHELAHIHRRDYATGFLARLAEALHFYHPLIWWLASRLQLQQELAADAVGAKLAGGRSPYMLALSRLALREDGQSPGWPARAFLPARGTLIRRIAMLSDTSLVVERPWSRPRRFLAAFCLFGIAAAVMNLRGPASAAEDKPAGPSDKSQDASVRAVNGTRARPSPGQPGLASTKPIEPVYVPENMVGLVAFRPAATFRRAGMTQFATQLHKTALLALHDNKKTIKEIEVSNPERLMLRLEDIEWVTCGINFGRSRGTDNRNMRAFMLGAPTVRSVRPFDWLAFLRSWGLEFTEVREPDGVYQKITGPLRAALGPNPCAYLPDDRTIVLAEEFAIQKLVRKGKPGVPAYLSGPEWARASRGLLAVAISNQDGAFVKAFDMGRPDDALVLSLFKGVDRWVFGVDDADAIALHALAVCGTDESKTIAIAIQSLVKLGFAALQNPSPEIEEELHGRALQMVKELLANVRVGQDEGSVELHTGGFGTLAEFGALVEADFDAEANPKQSKKDPTK